MGIRETRGEGGGDSDFSDGNGHPTSLSLAGLVQPLRQPRLRSLPVTGRKSTAHSEAREPGPSSEAAPHPAAL